MTEVDQILNDWKKHLFKPIYWFEGEEDYFIDKLITFAEHNILSETDAAFNLSVFYGKDANVHDIINSCRRYPVMTKFQIVIVKEAQILRNIEQFENYVQKMMSSTVLIVGYKDKKLDGRKKLAKLIIENGILLTTKKIYDNKLPEWTNQLIASYGLTITNKANQILVDHIGNNLSRIENEIKKLLLNIGDRKKITEADIEEYIGISKEFNVFELSNALGEKNLQKAIRIVQYFESNPKAINSQMVGLLIIIFEYFNKLYCIQSLSNRSFKEIMEATGIRYYLQDYINASKVYSQQSVENIFIILHEYSLKIMGVTSVNYNKISTLKELVCKIMAA